MNVVIRDCISDLALFLKPLILLLYTEVGAGGNWKLSTGSLCISGEETQEDCGLAWWR